VTDLYSVSKQETVWGIESRSKISQGFDQVRNYAVIVDEAEAIARYLSRDGLISQ
jgi:hypothetical protein